MRQPARHRIGLMLELDWPFERHLGVFAGTQRYARQIGNWECIVDERIPATIREAGGKRIYDGIIARATVELADIAAKLRVPVVNTWYSSPATSVPLVAPDVHAAAGLAARHLLSTGLRQFICIATKNCRADVEGAQAFAAIVRAENAACEFLFAPANYGSSVDARHKFHQSLPGHVASWQPPLGIYVTTLGTLARHLAHEVMKQDLRIPHEVAIVAGINEPMVCLYPPPSLSSVEVSYEEVGYQAAKLLDEQMKQGKCFAGEHLVPPTQMVPRESTDFPCILDPLVIAALQYISENVQYPLNVGKVAEATHTSRRTLERRFHDVLGRTIAHEIRRLRIERAKRYLVDSTIPIKSVARLAGFSSRQRMYEAFRDAGISLPTQLRQAR